MCVKPERHRRSSFPRCSVIRPNSFACAAPFSLRETHIPLMDLATIHTPYVPGAAQGVETGFSADNRWLIYNDTVDGVKQVCVVCVEG